MGTMHHTIIMMHKIAYPSTSCLAGIAVSLAIYAADGLVLFCTCAVVFTLTLRPFHPSASCIAGIAISLAISAADGFVLICTYAVVFTHTLGPLHPSASCLAGIAVSLAISATDGLVFFCAHATLVVFIIMVTRLPPICEESEDDVVVDPM